MLTELTNNDLDRIALAFDRKQLPFTLYRDLAATSTKEWLVKNLLGHAECSAAYGAPGSGKSALVEDMALHIAAGLPWHGRQVKHGAVVYIVLERQMLVKRRAIAFREYHGIQDLPFAVVGGVFDFKDYRTAAVLADIVRRVEETTGQKTVLVVVDTVSRALASGDENSSKDMGALVNTTARLQEATGAHIQLVHHVPVDGGGRLRGHGALLGALDTTISVEKLNDGLRTATVIKANDSEEGEQVTFKLGGVTIGEETTAPIVVPAKPKTTPAAPEQKLSKNQRTMFSVIYDTGSRGLTTDDLNKIMRDDAGIGAKRKADLVDIRTALQVKGLIYQAGDRWMAKR